MMEITIHGSAVHQEQLLHTILFLRPKDWPKIVLYPVKVTPLALLHPNTLLCNLQCIRALHMHHMLDS